MKRILAFLLASVCAGYIPAQTNNIGTPIPPSAFGITINDTTLVPVVPYSIVRSWDGGDHLPRPSENPARGVFQWSNLDAWIAAYPGRDLLYTFGPTPAWSAADHTQHAPYPYVGQEQSSCTMDANIADWDTWVTAVATHVGSSVKYWELWNEPMNSQYFCVPAVDGTTYTNGSTVVTLNPVENPSGAAAATYAWAGVLFSHARDIIKRINPNAVILGPSLDKDFGLAWLGNYTANGGQVVWDATNIHGYPNDGGAYTAPESMVGMIAQYAAWNAAHGIAGMPIIDTETAWGAAIGDGGKWLAKDLILSWSSGVSRTIWYKYDNPTPALDGQTMDLWDTGLNHLTDQGIAYQQVYNWMVGATMTAACAQDGAGTFTCPLSRPGGYQGLVTWNTASTVSMTAPTGMSRYRDLQGVTHAIGGPVSVSSSPVLIETASTAKVMFLAGPGGTQLISQ